MGSRRIELLLCDSRVMDKIALLAQVKSTRCRLKTETNPRCAALGSFDWGEFRLSSE